MAKKPGGEYAFFDKIGVVKSRNTEAVLGMAERLKRLLESQNRSQRQLAQNTPGLNHAMMGYIMRSNRDPQLSSVALIADALGVTLEELAAGVTTTIIGDTSDERRVVRMLDVVPVARVADKKPEPDGFSVVPAGVFPADIRVVRQSDDSMTGVYDKGDLVFVSPSKEATPGCYVLAIAGGRAMLREYHPRYNNAGGVVSFELVPAVNTWPRITCDKSEPGKVLGVAVGSMRID